ncbi:glycoside hydrolase family 3 N-terminal domain-containing protein [Demequina sp. SYSU T00192]|uniref:Glycoside hydrolase family 3 N-terminal domain-containing protein n=1 Tax=Demequina litoralis TaxID=3051660 RepID=A0ABT8G7R3_9MICO|nr:glycoside hydrolase family 3 N-terminal domain-containing protein [Demequina sp. SYSU T00192]MDN4474969.1 glycoside hydrolase family 3 N-terminal domain-containing protein [Demequina sp. SYSU T00192]
MNPLAPLMPGFVGHTLPGWLEQRLRDGLGGVCLFAANVESPAQLRALTDAIHAANPHAVVSIDEEGGDVSRLYQAVGSPFPGNAVLGRMDDAAATEAVAARVGAELAAAGVDLTLAPDVDVNADPRNPVIGVRSFGTDPALVARHSAAWVAGVQAQGVSACAKHFPGHGDTAKDSHLDLPTVDADAETLHARDLPPFVASLDAGVATVMTSHIMVPALDPELPATFSRPILQGLLRAGLGFDGVIVTDALDMKGACEGRGIPAAAVLALAAGADLLCLGSVNPDEEIGEIAAAIEAAVADGSLDEARVIEASERCAALGRAHAARRAAASSPAHATPVPAIPGAAAVRATFEVSDAAAAALTVDRPRAWLRLEPAANVAVGNAPWGPFACGVEAAATFGPDGDPASFAAAVPAGALAVVVGKDNHRHPWALAAIDAVRGRGDAVVVDMGWPGDEAADVATFGASRLVGGALLELIGH